MTFISKKAKGYINNMGFTIWQIKIWLLKIGKLGNNLIVWQTPIQVQQRHNVDDGL